MPHTAKQAALEAFLHSTEWIRPPFSVSFLAAGEYNENHLVENEDGRYVLRINHGSQLGLGPRQIEYEFQVLKALEPTGVTPRAFFCEPDPGTLQRCAFSVWLRLARAKQRQEASIGKRDGIGKGWAQVPASKTKAGLPQTGTMQTGPHKADEC